MKFFLPAKKSLKYITNFFEKINLEGLIHLSRKNKPQVNDMVQEVLYQPDLKDLYFLYQLIILNKRITVLEVGCGWSSVVIRKALNANKIKYSKEVKNLRRKNHFECISIDNEKKWILNAKKLLKKFKINHNRKDFFFSNCEMTEIKGNYATRFTKFPLINPDLIYLDGPDQFNIKGKIRNFTISHKDMMPMTSDILSIEYYLTPGTIILMDGRTANARFLRDNLKRNWNYKYLESMDINIFFLNEKPLGKYNRQQLKFYNFI
jgi:hypothetical protein